MAKLILLAGGSAAGKSTLARALQEELNARVVSVISLDHYYHDLGHLSDDDLNTFNFDHPRVMDLPRILADVTLARDHKPVILPFFDVITHRRTDSASEIPPSDFVIVEGIFALHFPELRALADFKIFIDVAPDLRLARRINRDIAERGFTLESVLDAYARNVRPMHEIFVGPSKEHADMIVPGSGLFENPGETMDDVVLAKLLTCLNNCFL